MNALELIAQDLFDKVRSRFSNLQMGGESGAVTVQPTEARFFDFDFVVEGNNLGRVSISINDVGTLKVYYSQGIVEDRDSITQGFWFDFLREMRQFAKRRMLRFDTRDITKGNLDKNDFAYLAQQGAQQQPAPVQVQQPVAQESNMTESSMYGSSKSSYRPLDKTLLIVRHNHKVGEDRGARSRSNNIQSIFIQNEAGERFKYPFVHMAGAKAMQRHVANGGTPFDTAGSAIVGMSEQINQLGKFKRQVGNVEQLTTEARGIVDRVGQKLSDLRATMEAIAKQTHYEAWRESLEEAQSEYSDIDEATIEDYKSKFTVSSFKEDLTQYFPLLFKVMQETSTVDLEDYVGEGKDKDMCETCNEDPCSCDDDIKETMDPFEAWAEEVVEGTVEEGSNSDLADKIKQLLASGAKVDSRSLGAMGHIERVEGNHITMRKLNSPGSKMRYSWLLTSKRADGLELVQAGPNHYVIRDTDEAWGDPQQSLQFDDVEVDEGSVHGWNVMKAYEKSGGDQIKITKWIRKELGLPKDYAVYFDDADLVCDDKTVVPNALVNPKLKMNDLLNAVAKYAGVQGKQNVGGTYREEMDAMEDAPKKVDVPAYKRKASGDKDWKVTQKDLDADDEKNISSRAGLKKLKKDLNMGEGYYIGAEDLPDWTRDALHRVSRGEVQDWTELYGELMNFIDDDAKAERIAKMTFAKGGGIDPMAKHRVQAEPEMDIPKDDDEDDDDSFLNKLRAQARSGSIKPGADTGEVESMEAQKSNPYKEIAEVVLSHFDRETGKFPLGETGVVVKISKEFGDKAGQLAEKLIQHLQSKHEAETQMEAIRRLSGLPAVMEKAGYSAKAGRAGKDLGKPGKNFAKIADKAGKKYGSKEKGEKVAGAVLAKLRKK